MPSSTAQHFILYKTAAARMSTMDADHLASIPETFNTPGIIYVDCNGEPLDQARDATATASRCEGCEADPTAGVVCDACLLNQHFSPLGHEGGRARYACTSHPISQLCHYSSQATAWQECPASLTGMLATVQETNIVLRSSSSVDSVDSLTLSHSSFDSSVSSTMSDIAPSDPGFERWSAHSACAEMIAGGIRIPLHAKGQRTRVAGKKLRRSKDSCREVDTWLETVGTCPSSADLRRYFASSSPGSSFDERLMTMDEEAEHDGKRSFLGECCNTSATDGVWHSLVTESGAVPM